MKTSFSDIIHNKRRRLLQLCNPAMIATMFALLFGTNPVLAQYTVQDVACPQNLNSCTAKDLKVDGASATLADPDQICLGADDEISLNLNVNYNTQATRFDVAFVIAEDGQDVSSGSGQCTTTAFIPGDGGFTDAEFGGAADSCGDLSQGATINSVPEVVTISCSNVADSGNLQFNGCTVWSQNTGGSFDDANGCVITDTSIDSGTGSKCRCDTFELDIPVYGAIKVEKKVVDYLGNPYPTMAAFDVEVTGSPTASQSGSVTTAASADFAVEAGTYSVIETDPLPAGYSYVGTECRDDPAGVPFGPNDIQVSFGDNITCTITNQIDPVTVIVEKILEGDYPAPAPNFELDVSCGGGTTFTLNTATDGLTGNFQVNPDTTCTVTEDTVPADWVAEIVTGSVTATVGGTNTLTIKNKYDAKRKVTLKKEVTDAPAGDATQFNLTLDCGTGYVATGSVGDDGMIMVADVPVGTSCTGVEADPGADWVYGGGQSLTVSEDSDDNTMTVTNKYDAKRKVTLKKVVTGAPAGDATEFDLTLDCGGVYTATGSVGNGGMIMVADVPVGTSCTGVEADPGNDWVYGGGQSLTVSEDSDDNTMTVTNKYDAKRKVTLKKVVTGAPAGDATQFDLTLDCGGVYTATGSVGNGGMIMVADVPVGTACTGVEADPGPDWAYGGGQSLTVSAVSTDNTMTVTNNYDATRKVTLKKVVTGAPAGDATEFDLTLDCGGTYTATGSVANGGMIMVANVPVGTTCTGVEADPGDDWVYGGGQSLTVSAVSADNTMTVTNTFVPTYLTLVKELVYLNGAPEVSESDFALSAGGVVFTQNTQTLVDAGSYALSEQDNTGTDFWRWILLSCDNGGTTSATNRVVELEAGDNVTCTFTNRDEGFIPDGYLQVRKEIQGGTATCADFGFTILETTFNAQWTGTGPECVSETLLVQEGTYTVTEDPYTVDYSKDESDCSSVVVTRENSRQNPAVCTIYNRANVKLYPTRTQGYWKTHPDAAAVHGSITVCGKTYSTTSNQYCSLFNQRGRKGRFLKQAAAAALNCAEWGCPTEVETAIGNNCNYNLAGYLDSYNNGLEGVSAHGVENPDGHGPADPRYCK